MKTQKARTFEIEEPSIRDIDQAIERLKKNDWRVMNLRSRTEILLPALIEYRRRKIEG